MSHFSAVILFILLSTDYFITMMSFVHPCAYKAMATHPWNSSSPTLLYNYCVDRAKSSVASAYIADATFHRWFNGAGFVFHINGKSLAQLLAWLWTEFQLNLQHFFLLGHELQIGVWIQAPHNCLSLYKIAVTSLKKTLKQTNKPVPR